MRKHRVQRGVPSLSVPDLPTREAFVTAAIKLYPGFSEGRQLNVSKWGNVTADEVYAHLVEVCKKPNLNDLKLVSSWLRPLKDYF